MANEDVKIDESLLDTVMAEDVDFKGHIRFSKSMLIKGKIEGIIESTGHLIVGKNAHIKAQITAGLISNYGTIEGNINGIERVELLSKAEVNGDITTPEIYIDCGCIFNGNCRMKKKDKDTDKGK